MYTYVCVCQRAEWASLANFGILNYYLFQYFVHPLANHLYGIENSHSLILFGRGGGASAPKSPPPVRQWGLRKIWWLPHPRPLTRALYAKLQREKLQFLSLLTTILKALICWKLESFRGLRPLAPGALYGWGPGARLRAPGGVQGPSGVEPPEALEFSANKGRQEW